jgi:CGNR zinc finger
MARGRYVESTAVRTLRALVALAEDERVSPETIARTGRAYILPPTLAALRALTPPQVQMLKQELREFFHAMAQGDVAARAQTQEQRFNVAFVAASGPSGIVLFVEGDPRDVLLYQASTFLQAIGTDRLRRCPAPDCGRVFVKVGRREYCSERCQRRVFISTYDPFKAQPRRKDRHGKPTRKR